MIKLRLYNFLDDEQEFSLPFLFPGFLQDEKTRRENISEHSEDALCGRCYGTGNEFFYHYKACSAGGGTGITKSINHEAEDKEILLEAA